MPGATRHHADETLCHARQTTVTSRTKPSACRPNHRYRSASSTKPSSAGSTTVNRRSPSAGSPRPRECPGPGCTANPNSARRSTGSATPPPADRETCPSPNGPPPTRCASNCGPTATSSPGCGPRTRNYASNSPDTSAPPESRPSPKSQSSRERLVAGTEPVGETATRLRCNEKADKCNETSSHTRVDTRSETFARIRSAATGKVTATPTRRSRSTSVSGPAVRAAPGQPRKVWWKWRTTRAALHRN